MKLLKNSVGFPSQVVIFTFTLLAALIIGHSVWSDAGNYVRSLANTLVSEGGARYTNHPNDPGGPTKYGITIHDVRQYLKKGATAADVKNLTEDQAKAIYKAHYWDAVDGDLLPRGLDYTVFDYTVNAGIGRSVPALKACMKALGAASTPKLITCVNDKRMAFQMGLGSRFDVFKRGWRNRINSVQKISLNMAAGLGPKKAGPGGFALPMVGPGKAYEEPDEQ